MKFTESRLIGPSTMKSKKPLRATRDAARELRLAGEKIGGKLRAGVRKGINWVH